MRTADIAQYLQNNPQFFEEHAELLTEITIPHPYGGRTISLSERQLLAMREKNKALEKTLHEMVEIAKSNDALQHKVHQFTCSLFGMGKSLDVAETMTRQLREVFAIPHAVLHTWQAKPPSAEMLTFTDELLQPVCTHHPIYDSLNWFGENGVHLRSFAYLPLRDGEQTVGLLILASEDMQRFYPEMGTLFLQRIAEIVSSALRPSL